MSVKFYAAIDLKSFYASVECIERGLDPLTTNLVVADSRRTDKTICLAVSPSLKALGIPGRPRLFEVVQKVNLINAQRKQFAKHGNFIGKSTSARALEQDKSLALDYIVATPQMAHYIKASTDIYKIYLQYIAPEDIHVYSIDEVFIDVTPYLELYKCNSDELIVRILREVLVQTGITATAGIGTNLYLAKIAMDIAAKHMPANRDGVRLAMLDEKTYREKLWSHTPITDFWRIGKGYADRLDRYGMKTMGDIALCSVCKHPFYNADLLYKMFGVNAELLIDHAWGWEPCTIKQIKDYRPAENSLSSGQVLKCPYTYDKAMIVVREMAEEISLRLMKNGLVTNQIVLTVGYDRENLAGDRYLQYYGDIRFDHYGRRVPKPAHGTSNIRFFTSSTSCILSTAMELFESIVDSALLIRRINITAAHVISEEKAVFKEQFKEIDLFGESIEQTQQQQNYQKELKCQRTVIELKQRYGKNAVLRGTDFAEGATAKERNQSIGGHKA